MGKKLAKAAVGAGALLFAVWCSGWLGGVIQRQLTAEKPDFLYRYASNGRFGSDVYFSPEVQLRYGVPEELLHPPEAAGSVDSAELARRAARRWYELLPALLQNAEYLRYLKELGTGLSELLEYCTRLDELEDSIRYVCRYVFFLAWVLLVHLLLRCRPALYFGMGLLCLIGSVGKLSGKLAAAWLTGSRLPLRLVADDLIPTMLEAMLTFLIFDITLAAWEKLRLGSRLAPLYEDLPAMQFLIAFLARYPESETRYRPNLSRLLPQCRRYRRNAPRTRKKAARLCAGIDALDGLHTNRTLLAALVRLQALLPPP